MASDLARAIAAASVGNARPLFTAEGPAYYQAAYAHNAPFAKPGPYLTALHPSQEVAFNQWLQANRVPFDPRARISDYDMPGYWQATGGQSWHPGMHFPDTYKTPYDTSFSNQSRYAKPGTPFVWHGNALVDTRTGRPIYR